MRTNPRVILSLPIILAMCERLVIEWLYEITFLANFENIENQVLKMAVEEYKPRLTVRGAIFGLAKN